MEDKSAKILLDVPVDDGVLGFDNYRDALINIIKSSDPHFTIGIFGGWGTGKTTLMKMMRKGLDDQGEVTVWFNPWQYEKEEHLIIPLLQTIELELKKHKIAKSQTIEKLGKTVLALASGFSAQIPIVGVDLSAKDAIETYQKLFESKNLSSIYFHLNQQLSNIITELKQKNKHRIVIFIDDLDRCLPDKALHVLESIKVFLDINGYVFVLGLSREIIEKCVDVKYGRESGITGSQYLRKMIQVPFALPGLREEEMQRYVERLKEELRGSEIREHIENYIDIIVTGMEANPREIKRFINNFILANRISQKETAPDKLLAVLTIQFRWEAFYRDLAKYKKPFLEQTAVIVKSREELEKEQVRKTAKESWNFFDFIEAHLEDEQFRNFLEGAGKVLFEIDDLDPYIHFSKSVVLEKEELKREWSREELISLLRTGRISEFNRVRTRPWVLLRSAVLTAVDLSGADLSLADLTRSDLSRADLSRTDLSKAVLNKADLSGADLGQADLSQAELKGALLRNAALWEASLTHAHLVRADATGANLKRANLTGANLEGAILHYISVGRTVFDHTIVTHARDLSPEIKDQLHIQIQDGVALATSKWLLEKRKSEGET